MGKPVLQATVLLSRTRDKTCDSARDALGLIWNSFESRVESFIYVTSYGYAGFKV